MKEHLKKLIHLLEWKRIGTQDNMPVVKERWKFSRVYIDAEDEREVRRLDNELRTHYIKEYLEKKKKDRR